ncbi:MAG: transposase [Candidatus Nitrospira kreftii]|uniref:Transposase n=1 Tax=Candidatus Nitrospira kreftii TaxID=2652173 RepID=A0A7S8FHM6_9BACT|nr:MAG: transposase [Candidatus Nitrospira kreftii]
MQDTALYQYLLGLQSPWTVSRVNLDIHRHSVDVWAEHAEDATWMCPHCAKPLPLYDHAEERTWRHLDSCQFQTYLHARIPRVACGEHGVVQVLVPWAEPRSRFTRLFERLAIGVLRQCDVSGATRILRISWDEAWGLMERAVTRGRQRKAHPVVRRIGVDEKAAAKGHHYLTLVCDLDEGTVEHIAEDRKQESLDSYYAGLTPEQLDGIEAIAMDMWEPYIQATRAQVPDADDKIVFDRFHVMGHISKAVDTVRKQEHRDLMASGDETLKGSKYLWLYSRENVPERWRDEFAALRRQELKVGRAWAIKEALRCLWHYVYPASGWKFWKRWYVWATHSRLEPMRKAAETIRRHIENILTYYHHPVTNAMSEGLNSQIQKIKSMAHGFRNIEYFKTAIYFHCGGLDLYPC